MKALAITGQAGQALYVPTDTTIPDLHPGQVLVKVKAAGINPSYKFPVHV
ncbi:MAG TPA: hypothetical protein VL727_26285 [Puia sp.]|nr:hypothetical protein [Puia sp.]